MPLISETWTTLAIALTIALSAGLLRGATGFGSALILAPVLARLYSPAEAVAISLMLGAAGSLQMLPRHLGHIDVPSVRFIGCAGLLHLIPGVLLLHWVSADVMRQMIAASSLIVAATLLAMPRYSGPAGPGASIVAGALGGLIMGSTSMGGPPVVLYLVSREGSARQVIGNIVAVVGSLEVGAIVLLTLTGLMDSTALTRFALLWPAFAAGTWIGQRSLHERMGTRYRPVILIILMLVGAASLIG